MLTLTKKTEYALLAACHLARQGRQTVVSARDMAHEHGVRLPLLMNVLKTLNQGGIVRSVRGARGGYALALAPAKITLGQIIEAVEGPARLVKCAVPQPDDPKCELAGKCPLSAVMKKIHREFDGFLTGVTVADVAFDAQFGSGKRKASRKVVAQ